MINITVTPGKPPPTGKRPPDLASCEWNGQRYEARAFSATNALARQLVAAECPDQPWQSFVHGARSLFGRSIHHWATQTVVERDIGGLRIQPYQEHPNAEASDER